MKQERLFLAFGAADPALLERSDRRSRAPAVRWGLAAAACLAILCAAAVSLRRPAAPVPPGDTPTIPDQPPAVETLHLTGGDVGRLHLEAIHYGAAETPGEFLLYVNEELYAGAWTDGAYVVRPLTPPLAEMPECSLMVSHHREVSLEAAAEEARRALEEEFSMVLDGEAETERITFDAYDGTEYGAEWDAANARITVVDDREGGVYTLTARFFTEAAEGLGRDFADMASTFQPVPAGVAVPDWMTSLQEAVDTLLPAVFSCRWTPEAKALLTEDAWTAVYETDVSDIVSVSAVDISPDDDAHPTSAVVSVRHRLSAEEPYDYVTMGMSYSGGRWQATYIGLER